MKYLVKTRMSFDLRSQQSISDERIIRDMAVKMIEGMELSDIRKLFNIKVLDPRSKEVIDFQPMSDMERIRKMIYLDLRKSQEVQYEARITVD